MSSQPKNPPPTQPEDRVTVASLQQQNYSVREIASVVGVRPARSAVNCAAMPRPASTAAARRRSKAVSSAAAKAVRCVNCTPMPSCSRWCAICCCIAGRPSRLTWFWRASIPGTSVPRVTRNDLQLHLCPARGRASQGADRLSAPGAQQARATQPGAGPARSDPDMLSIHVRPPRLRTASSRPLGR